MPQPIVLVVDDQPDSCRMLVRVMRMEGLAAHCCTSGEAALEYLASNVPGVIILDVMMPGMDGIAVLRKIRDELQLKIPVILFTAIGDKQFREYALKEGATDYWVKTSIDYRKLPELLAPYLPK